ncbi:DUF2336 domain-containing protein [Caulobacter sp. 17J80-11]|uniref:DUF2336 domain-containing protein n=1 Tax=Caulobacter sp. 17J80-11 TaxID=2763502 RepID=UPI0016535D81|nr:DUF2336 domain-containing protein [Caulobacter sp. 17J80-11]
MSAAVKTESLLLLAQSRQAGDRERLLLAIADLCDGAPEAGRPEIQALLGDVFMTLVVDAERDIRRALAERLGRVEWAPRGLIHVLALDEIDIARPIIAASSLLDDAALVRVVVEATLEHQIEVARRPYISESVVDALIDHAGPEALVALAANDTAATTEDSLARLVDASRRIAALRSPLARHPRLTRQLAEQLYAWVGQALRQAIVSRFRIDVTVFDSALSDAVQSAIGGAPRPAPVEDAQSEARLVAKLQAAGQLRPGYLVRVLKEGQLGLFVQALATLGEFDASDVRAALRARTTEPLALACAAVGIDRVVFPDILGRVMGLNGGRPGGAVDAGKRTAAAFSLSPREAADAFRMFVERI